MKKILTAILVTFCLATTASAATLGSSVIDLGAGDISPGGSFTLSLEKLVSGITYDISCEILNPATNNIIMGIMPTPFLEQLNGIAISGNPNLHPSVNFLILQHINSNTIFDNLITFTNSDQEAILGVIDCSATAVAP